MTADHLNRREFGQASIAFILGLIATACSRLPGLNTTQAPEPTQAPQSTQTQEPTQTAESTPILPTEKHIHAENSLLLLPETVVNNGRASINTYLNGLVRNVLIDPNLSVSYINNPGMLPDNDEEPALLSGKKEPGQSQAELALQPLAPEVRLISGGQFVLPLSKQAASDLPSNKVERESNAQGGINTHLVYKKVKLFDGRPGVLIPGGKDPDQNVHTPEGNYNRGNILLVLSSTEQGQTSLFAQVDTGANWQAQYAPKELVLQNNGLPQEILSYMLYNPDAQRSEEHGLSAMESMFKGTNCQGQGCRSIDDQGIELAEMAGVGVYVVQINPKGDSVDLLSATVIADSELQTIFPHS